MLQSATVHPATLAILKRIMLMPILKPFNLAVIASYRIKLVSNNNLTPLTMP